MAVVKTGGVKKQRVDAVGQGDIGTIHAVRPVEQGTHTVAVGLRRAARQRHQKGEYYDQILHRYHKE